MADFYAIPTDIGEAKLANALALGVPLQISHLAVGDGVGAGAQGTPIPNPVQTVLVSEKRRAAINTLATDPGNANVLIAEQVIPEDVGGWWIREMGLFDIDGDLIAVCNTPPTYKPLLSSGSGRTQIVRMGLIVSDVAAVTLKIDPAVVLATRQYVDQKTSSLAPIISPAFQGVPTAPTPAQFDDGEKVATTKFVQRALGNDAGIRSVSAARALTADDVGHLINSFGGSAYTITLPNAADVVSGAKVAIINTSGGVNISRAGANTISLPGGTTTSTLAIDIGDTAIFERVSAASWLLVGGTLALKYAASFASNLAANGHQKLPSGRIRQWGIVSSSGTSVALTFPIAFPNACRSFVALPIGGNGTAFGSWHANTPGKTGITLYSQNANMTYSWEASGD